MDGVGSKAVAKKSTITNVFDKFKKVNGNDKAVGKFSFQKERFIADDTSSEDEEEESEGSMKDFIDDQSSDEFDDMTKGEKSSMEAKKTKIFETMKSSSDDDSEDEDFKKMSTEEQMLAMIPRSLDGVCDIDDLDESDFEELNPRLNLDGFLDDSDEDDDDRKRMSAASKKALISESDNSDVEPEPEKSKSRNKREHSNDSEEFPPKRSKSNSLEMYESDASLPDVEEEEEEEEAANCDLEGKEKVETSDNGEKEEFRPASRENGEPGCFSTALLFQPSSFMNNPQV